MVKLPLEEYLTIHYGTTPNVQLVKNIEKDLGISTTTDAIRNRWYKMQGGTMTHKTPASRKREAFTKFLLKGRTEKEISEKFGNTELLKEKFEGLTLFTQRNTYHELVYILLPISEKSPKPKPRRWKYNIGKDEHGNEQPYLLVQMPNFKKKLIIAPLFDVHYGSHAHRHEKFLGYLRWIAETPNVFVILGGDLLENAVDDGRGMTYDQTENPESQFDTMIRLLTPIAHKILVSVPGNHEERTYKKTGTDMARLLAERLDIPYFTGPVIMSIMGNSYKWTFYVRHGRGNAQTKGGKMNAASRPKQWTGLIHFFVSGHVHDCLAEPEVVLIEDPLYCRLQYIKQWVVVAPSFLEWYKTYAYRAEYKPMSAGGVSMELYADGTYKAYLTE